MGRHREFDADEALEQIVRAFWRQGYEGTSYTDLTAETGIQRPSLYAAFGNKQSMFLKALDRYFDEYWAYVPAALEQQTSKQVAEQLFNGAVDLATRYPDRPGCFGVNAALAVSPESEAARLALVDARAAGEGLIRQRLTGALESGDLPGDANPAVLAAYLMAVMHGIAVQAKAGFPAATLSLVAAQALSGWPTSPAA